jgi:signal transduction histidine kinase
MPNTTFDYYILFVPSLLILLGLGLGMFWLSARNFASIFWLAVSALCNGTAIFIQSFIAIHHITNHHFYLALLYLLAYIALTQSILVFFKQQISLKFCILVLCCVEIGLLYFSFVDDLIFVCMLILAMGTTFILLHRLPQLLKTPTFNLTEKSLKNLFILITAIFIFRSIALVIFIYIPEHSPINFANYSHWFMNQLTILIFTLLFVILIFIGNLYKNLDIQKSNIKIQEKIQFSYDVHDILGSSVVRSITHLSHYKKPMDNQHFLSLLQQLKHDLLHVTHLHQDTTYQLPLTPTLWAAPIRLHFDPIFLALEMEIQWKFSEMWHTQSTLHDYHTLGIVLDEILTNLIKHSHAKQIQIHLYDSALYPFILDIADDGIGFDPQQIQQNHQGIGLRSMQQRLNNIQAKMHIQSHTGKTFIQIIKLP